MAEERKVQAVAVNEGRRRLLKAMGVAAGGMAASTLVPDRWVKPGVNLGVIPSLAQTSPVLGTGDLQVTVTWDTNCTDIDTFVQEPDGTWVSFDNKVGPTATLDYDNTDGYGPENVYVPAGAAATGTYKVYVGYWNWSSDCGSQETPATQVTIRITTHDGAPGMQQQTFTRDLTVANMDSPLHAVAWVAFPSGDIEGQAGTESRPFAADAGSK